jgi:thiol-disulfide isomerase/thioredoxin
MNLQTTYGRVLCLHAAAKRLRIPERTLRYQASRGWIQGAYKQGKLWKFPLPAIEKFQPRRMAAIALIAVAICLVSPMQAADLHLEKYRGKVVLLNFWATWCHGCKLEIPWFMEYQKKYKHSGFTVVGVAMDEEGWKLVRPYVKEKKINYPTVVGDDSVAREYGIKEMPMSLIIGRDGKVVSTHRGMVNRDGCEGEIRDLLKSHAR